MGTILLVVSVWLVLGLIALGLGYVLISCDDSECKINRLKKNLFIVVLGLIALLGMISDIQDEHSNY
jgi:hypothetical protein